MTYNKSKRSVRHSSLIRQIGLYTWANEFTSAVGEEVSVVVACMIKMKSL